MEINFFVNFHHPCLTCNASRTSCFSREGISSKSFAVLLSDESKMTGRDTGEDDELPVDL